MAYTFKHGDRPLDGYTVQRAVGRGGFGEVYYAISDGGREVAVKYLRDNPQVELRGVSHCINLKSPHLVSIFDVKKTDEDDYCIIMEYCSGPSLRDLLIAEPNGFAPEKAAFFLREIAKGLSYLHDRGIVHRDLKPGNIFYDDGYVKIGDYGLSKIITVSRHSAQTASVGTVHYMAPEIGSGNYSRGVDIYALGVILYEMLMGTVPFEGSTMAEVLMKHLTSQPEVDKLPQPFGKVIRKALEKDPKDRYQTVDEMVEELLGAEEIEKSLAGFSPKSLQSAVRHGGADHASPVPSPNPAPRPQPQGNLPPFAIPVGSGRPLTGKAKRRLDRIARKVERKRAKLAGTSPNYAPPTAPVAPPPPPSPGEVMDRRIRRRRIALTVFMGLVLSITFGVVCGNAAGGFGEEIGGAAGMLIPALAGAIALGRKATRWFAIEQGPNWAASLVRAGCALPLLALACSPILQGAGHRDGLSVWIAMVIMVMFANWNKTIDECASGEVSFWRAVWTGIGGLFSYGVVSAIMDSGPDDIYMWVTFGGAGITSLLVQASSWWLQPVRALPGGGRPPYDGDDGGSGGYAARYEEPAASGEAETVLVGNRWDQQAPHGMHAHAVHDTGDLIPPAKIRWGITRAFWGFVTLAASFGCISTFVLSLVGFGNSSSSYDDTTGAILGCIGSFCLTIFALRKTTAVKRDGFWRETLRPFLISASMFGIGGPIVGISREWGHRWSGHSSCQCVDDTGAAFLIATLVVSSLMFLFLTFFTGRRRPKPKSFLTGTAPTAAPLQSDMNAEGGRIVAVGNVDDVDPLAATE